MPTDFETYTPEENEPPPPKTGRDGEVDPNK